MAKAAHKRYRKNYTRMDWQLHIIILLPILFLLVFNYIPMFGLRLAFVEKLIYRKGIWGSPWAGLKWFEYIFTSLPEFGRAFRNTLIIATSKLIFGSPVPIIVALLLNQVKFLKYKKFIQTTIFLPYFISWVVLGGVVKTIFAHGGVFDKLLGLFGTDPETLWLQNDLSFVLIVIATDIWKGFGYGTIIYLAALTGIDPNLYEAAEIDGANKFKQEIFVTIPMLVPIIMLNLILNLGSIVNANFDQVINLYNPLVYEWGDILDTYVYRITLEGMSASNYPIGTAIGLFKSLISFFLIFMSNYIVTKFSDYRIL